MKMIFVHHANRQKGNPPSQDDDITSLGEQDAIITAQLLKRAQEQGMNIKAIFSPPIKRCMKTAKIISDELSLEITEEPRFDEFGSVPHESWVELQNRVREALFDIVCKFDNNDAVVCINSGFNIVAFMQLAFYLPPSKKAPFVHIPSCSPLVFEVTKENFI